MRVEEEGVGGASGANVGYHRPEENDNDYHGDGDGEDDGDDESGDSEDIGDAGDNEEGDGVSGNYDHPHSGHHHDNGQGQAGAAEFFVKHKQRQPSDDMPCSMTDFEEACSAFPLCTRPMKWARCSMCGQLGHSVPFSDSRR